MTKAGKDDPWSSVENMLRWQITLARKNVTENLERLQGVGELYDLPKAQQGSKPHGLPEQWAFGSLTPQQVGKSDALRGLRLAEREIQQAEGALADSRLPESIYLILKANRSINSALALWHSSAAITTWRYVGKFRKAQAIRAGSNRATVSADDGKFSMTELARGLAAKTDRLGDPLPAKQLWIELINLLTERGAAPEEPREGDLRVEYTKRYEGNEPVRKTYSFKSFSQTVSRLRDKKN